LVSCSVFSVAFLSASVNDYKRNALGYTASHAVSAEHAEPQLSMQISEARRLTCRYRYRRQQLSSMKVYKSKRKLGKQREQAAPKSPDRAVKMTVRRTCSTVADRMNFPVCFAATGAHLVAVCIFKHRRHKLLRMPSYIEV
jgi:hypothetical protein